MFGPSRKLLRVLRFRSAGPTSGEAFLLSPASREWPMEVAVHG